MHRIRPLVTRTIRARPAVEISARRALTIIELLVCIAILTVLAALAAPAIQQARESARRTMCRSQFRQIGLAVGGHCAAQPQLPTSEIAPWPIVLSPWLEQTSLAARFDRTRDVFGSESNARLGSEPFLLLLCPSDQPILVDPWSWMAANAAFNVEFNGRRLSDCTDGLSQTILVAEVLGEHRMPWIIGPEKHVDTVESAHQGIFHVLLGDGSVRPLNSEIATLVLRALSTPAEGVPVTDL